MKAQINLATPVKTSRNKRYFLLISLGFFGLCFVLAMILLSYSLVLNNSYNALTNQETTLKQQLVQIGQKKVEYLTVKERLISIQKILNLRQNLNTNLVAVVNLFPESVTISALNVTPTSVVLTANSANLQSLNSIMETIIPKFEKENKNLKSVQLSSFSQDPNTLAYSVSLQFTFKK